MGRYMLVFEYLGTNFAGYQIQPNKRTVQQEMENALKLVLNEDIKIFASGRTDAGVHSLGQVVHFDTNVDVNCGLLLHNLNEILPEDISVFKAKRVDDDFDARFSSKVKTYVYKFYLCRYERAIYQNRALRVNDNVDVNLMKIACKYLVGEHDFTSFVAKKSGKTNFVRTIYSAEITETESGLFEFKISGNGFLYNMVRIIMGTLIDVGSKRKTPEDIAEVINAKNRAKAGKTVPPHGLYMYSVKYE